MENLIWLLIMAPCSMLFTGIGIYAWKRKKPIWFWSGSTVSSYEITDIYSYNRANGIMWLGFSACLWISTLLGVFRIKAGAICLLVACVIGIPALPLIYGKIYRKYKR